MKADYDRISKLLTDTVTLLCKNGLTYERELKVQGLLAVTIDTVDVFVVQINESFEIPSTSNAHSGSNEKSSYTSHSEKFMSRKRAAASRSNDDFVDLTRIVETSQVDMPTFHGRNLQVRSQGSASAGNSSLRVRMSEPLGTPRSRGITIGNCWPLCSGGPPLMSAPPMYGRFSNSALQMRGLIGPSEMLMLPENASALDALFQTKQPSSLGLSGSAMGNMQPSSLGLSGSAMGNRPLGPKNLQLPSLQWPYNSSFAAPNVAQNMQLGVPALQRYQMNSVDASSFPSGTLGGSHVRAPLFSARQRVMPNSAMSVGKSVFATQNTFQCPLDSRNGPVSRISDSAIAFNSSKIRYQQDWSVPQNSVKSVSRSNAVSNCVGMVSSLIYSPPLPVVMCPPYGEESNGKSSLNISDNSFQHAVNSKSSCQTASAISRKTLSSVSFSGIVDSGVPDPVLPTCGVVTIEPDGTDEDGDQGPVSASEGHLPDVKPPITSDSSSREAISKGVITDEGMSKPVQEVGLDLVQLPHSCGGQKESACAQLSVECGISKNHDSAGNDVEVDECESHVDSDLSKKQNESGVDERVLGKPSEVNVSVDINQEGNVSNDQSKQVEVDQVGTSNYPSQESTTEHSSANDFCDSLKDLARPAEIDLVGMTSGDGPSISTGDVVEGGASECISTDDGRTCVELESCAAECSDKGGSSVLSVDQRFEMPVLHSEASTGSVVDLHQPTLNPDLTFESKNFQNTDSYTVHENFISPSSVADSLRFLISTAPRCDTFACKVKECHMTYKIASDLAFHYSYQHPEVIAGEISSSTDLSVCKKRRSRRCLSVGNAYAKRLRSSTASKREYSEQTRGWRDFSLVRPHAPASKYARHRPKKFSCCLNECRQRYSSLKRLLTHLRVRHPDFQSNGWQMKSSTDLLDTACRRNPPMSGMDFKLSLVRTVNSAQAARLASSAADEPDGKTCMGVVENEHPEPDCGTDGPSLESAG